MPQSGSIRRLEICGDQGLDMPLRVLGLVSQLGLCPDRIVIERGPEGQSIDVLLEITESRGALLVQKLSSMVLVRGVTLS